MIDVQLKEIGGGKRTVSLPITEEALQEARPAYRKWIAAHPHDALYGAWGVHVEQFMVVLPWYGKLDAIDKCVATCAVTQSRILVIKGRQEIV